MDNANQENNQSVDTNTGNIDPQIIYKTDKKIVYLLSILLFCSITIIGFLLWKIFNKPNNNDLEGYSLNSTSTPTSSISNNNQLIKSNRINLNGLIVPYPDTWIPIFASLDSNTEKKVYFVENEFQANSLIECSKLNNCTNYLATLEMSTGHAVWASHSLENFIKETNKSVDIIKLQRSSLNGYEVWQGYNGSETNIYNFVIGNKNMYGYLMIKSDNKNNLDKIVSLTKDINYNELKNIDITKSQNTKAFIITFDSSITTPNNSGDIDSYILSSLLGTNSIKSHFHYLLYTDTSTQKYPTPANNFSGSYYLLTDNIDLKVGSYGTPQIKIVLEKPQKETTNKYLSNRKYCETDNDCVKTTNYCTLGVFNKYHQYMSPWGCGPVEYENLENSMTFDDKLKCETDLKFDSIKCVNNSCLGVNPQAVCK